MNDIQQAILNRLNSGEERINYHPQSLIGGEVIDLVDAGLIEAHVDEQGFTYLTLPSVTD
jgi:hypothetical protein